MPEAAPRYEFRIFAENLIPVLQSMKEMCGEPLIRESEEVYIVSEFCWDTNIKIRGGVLDIKVQVQERDGLEQWVPREKLEFPLEGKFVQNLIKDDIFFEEIHSESIEYKKSYSLGQFLGLMRSLHGVKVVEVKKRRFGFLKGECMMEFAELDIGGKAFHTVAVESTDVVQVLRLLKELDIDGRENVNYPLAIRRMVGLEPEGAGEHC